MAQYPAPVYHFSVDWGGKRTGFSEISGLSIEADVVEYREGNSPEYSSIKMPGQLKYSNIIFKRGILPGDNEFYQWLNTINLNSVERRNINITLLNENHEPVVIWKVKNAFPVRLEGPVLNAESSEVAVETLEIAHEGLTIEHP